MADMNQHLCRETRRALLREMWCHKVTCRVQVQFVMDDTEATNKRRRHRGGKQAKRQKRAAEAAAAAERNSKAKRSVSSNDCHGASAKTGHVYRPRAPRHGRSEEAHQRHMDKYLQSGGIYEKQRKYINKTTGVLHFLI